MEDGFFAEVFRTADTEAAYRDFLARYQPWQHQDLAAATPLDAYSLAHDARARVAPDPFAIPRRAG